MYASLATAHRVLHTRSLSTVGIIVYMVLLSFLSSILKWSVYRSEKSPPAPPGKPQDFSNPLDKNSYLGQMRTADKKRNFRSSFKVNLCNFVKNMQAMLFYSSHGSIFNSQRGTTRKTKSMLCRRDI